MGIIGMIPGGLTGRLTQVETAGPFVYQPRVVKPVVL